jgi:hypothetical protein
MFRAQGLGLRVQRLELGFRAQGSMYRVEGLELRVQCSVFWV